MIVCKNKNKVQSDKGEWLWSDWQKNHCYYFNTFLFYLINLWQTSDVGHTTAIAKLPLYPNFTVLIKINSQITIKNSTIIILLFRYIRKGFQETGSSFSKIGIETYRKIGTSVKNFLVSVNCSPWLSCSQWVSLLALPWSAVWNGVPFR